MINVYSIKDILEASNNILNSSAESKVVLSSDKNEIVNKKNISIIEDKILSVKSDVVKENTFNVLEKIILEAENSPLNINNKLDDRIEHIDEKNLLEQNTISQKKLIEDLYKTFGKKIKKNSLKLILENRIEIIHLTKNIFLLKKNKNEIEQSNIKLHKNIKNLKEEENNLQNNLDISINGFNKLNLEHKNLKIEFNKLKENFNIIEIDLKHKKRKISILEGINKKFENKIDNLENKIIEYKATEFNLGSKVKKLENYININNAKHDELTNQNINLDESNTELKTRLDSLGNIGIYHEEIDQLKLKNKDLENTNEKLKSYEDNKNQNLNIINELEGKIKHYQEENIRISNQLYEANKKFDIIKSEIEVMLDQRSRLIAKINSVNDVIDNSKIITNVFNSPESMKNEINVQNEQKNIKSHKDINDEINNIFSKTNL